MIRLKFPLNYRGVLIETGSVVEYLPVELQEKLIKSGAAERVVPETVKKEKPADEKPIDKMTKAELLELATKLFISGVSEEMTKAEIIELISAAKQKEDDINGTQESDSV